MTNPDPNAMPEPSNADMALIPDSVAAWIDWQAQQIATLENQLDLAPTSQWRDISTAPRDGTEVLGYHKILGAHLVYWGIKPRNNPNFFWISSYDEIIHIDQPTHWMALPPTKDLAAEGLK